MMNQFNTKEKTLTFIMIAAIKRLYPSYKVNVQHSLSNGLFCKIYPEHCTFHIEHIRNEMQTMIQEKLDIKKETIPTIEAIQLFQSYNQFDTSDLLSKKEDDIVTIYTLDNIKEYFTEALYPNTSYIDSFQIKPYKDGFWLSSHGTLTDQEKLFDTFQEFEAWGKTIGVQTISQLNKKIAEGKIDELILMSEILIDKKLSNIAHDIVHNHSHTRFILISGPSSAGKTTFSRRLSLHLKLYGLETLPISMDDFFKERDETPRLPDGSYDFESPNCIDLDLFSNTLLNLLEGKSVQIPSFNFSKGIKEWKREPIALSKHQILIIEGIHGLNPDISKSLPQDSIYKIYINALTHMNLDDHNYIPTSEYRLIRRISRDSKFRGASAKEIIEQAKHVTDGENKYIYPYQEEANVIFNTSMPYELSILKPIVEPLLKGVPKNCPEYEMATQLKNLLCFFEEAYSQAIPRTSILAEFTGESILDL